MAKNKHSLHLSDHPDLKKTSDYAQENNYKVRKYTRLKSKADPQLVKKTNTLIDEANQAHISPTELTQEINETNGEDLGSAFDTWLST